MSKAKHQNIQLQNQNNLNTNKSQNSDHSGDDDFDIPIPKEIFKKKPSKKSKEPPKLSEFVRGFHNYSYIGQHIPKTATLRNEQVISLVPLNPEDTNGNKFTAPIDGFIYIAQHCQKYYGRFYKEVCEQHLKECYFYDFNRAEFVPFRLLNKGIALQHFNKYYHQASRQLKYCSA